jgi:hypothetical protein
LPEGCLIELTQLARNIDELRGFLADMEEASLDPIKLRRYIIAFLSRAKRLATSPRHDLSSYTRKQGLNYNELKKVHTWQRHAQSNSIMGDTVPKEQLLTSVPDVLTTCKVYMDSADQFFNNLRLVLSVSN